MGREEASPGRFKPAIPGNGLQLQATTLRLLLDFGTRDRRANDPHAKLRLRRYPQLRALLAGPEARWCQRHWQIQTLFEQ